MEDLPPVSTEKWLLMLAHELEGKHFPPGYAPHLRNVAAILSTSGEQIAQLENVNVQLHEKLAQKEQEFHDIRKDMSLLWARYQKATEIVSKHEPQTSIAMAEYKPRFFDIL